MAQRVNKISKQGFRCKRFFEKFFMFFRRRENPMFYGVFREKVSIGKHGFPPARRRRAKKHHENAPIAPSAYLKNTLIRTTSPCKQYSGSIKPTSPYEPDHTKSWNQRTLAATPGLFRQEHKWTTEDKLRSLSGLHSSFFFLVQCAVVERKFWLQLGLKALLCARRENFATVFRH